MLYEVPTYLARSSIENENKKKKIYETFKSSNSMTPKEKASELVDKYRNYIISFLSDTMKDKNAKTASLIAVEEIINALRNINEIDETIFWLDVKQEIEKL